MNVHLLSLHIAIQFDLQRPVSIMVSLSTLFNISGLQRHFGVYSFHFSIHSVIISLSSDNSPSTLSQSSGFLSSSSSYSFNHLPTSSSSSLSSSVIQLNLEVTTVAGWHRGLNKTRTIASPLLPPSHSFISPLIDCHCSLPPVVHFQGVC